MRDYMDRRVTPPKRVTSPTRGPPPPCKQALTHLPCPVVIFQIHVPCFLKSVSKSLDYINSYDKFDKVLIQMV